MIELAPRPQRGPTIRLTREVISELHKSHEAFQKQLQVEGDKQKYSSAELAQHLAVHAELVELLMYGRIEEAALILDTIDSPDGMTAMSSQGVRVEYARIRERLFV